jgi:tetratricopeptide (TPR) repeat protein
VPSLQETAMAHDDASILPPPSPEHRRVAAGQFERANQVIATGNFDYGIQLLMTCCKLDPANLIYRRRLRQVEKTKYKNNLYGSRLAILTTWAAKARLKACKRAHDFLKVLEHGEEVLVRNPWDTGVQLAMAEAAEKLDLLDLAVWLLEQARQKNPKDVTVNRSLARLFERRGHFNQAMTLWELIRSAAPRDAEARDKAKDLAASATIAKGHYEDVIAAAGAEGENAEAAEEDDEPELAKIGISAAPAMDRTAQEAARLKARIDKEPTSTAAYLNLAGLYRRAGQFDQARAVLEQGLGPTGRDFELTTELAEVAIDPFRQNLAIVEDKLHASPADEELRKMRIRLLKEINTRELDLYRQKADHYPTEKSHRFQFGVRLLRAGRVDEAIGELQAIRNDPRHRGRVLTYLGYCFETRHNWRLAERNFEEALQHLPAGDVASRKEVLFQLAKGAAGAGELAKAVDRGYELANLDFNYHEIGRLVDEWQTQLSKANVSGSSKNE